MQGRAGGWGEFYMHCEIYCAHENHPLRCQIQDYPIGYLANYLLIVAGLSPLTLWCSPVPLRFAWSGSAFRPSAFPFLALHLRFLLSSCPTTLPILPFSSMDILIYIKSLLLPVSGLVYRAAAGFPAGSGSGGLAFYRPALHRTT